MPLEEKLRNEIDVYCKKDLPGDIDWFIGQFSFIDDIELKSRLGKAYYSARYMSKVMEALHVSGDEMHPFIKFQIIQYASIYEAVITYLLWDKFKEHPEVKLLQTHKAYKRVNALGCCTQITYGGDELFTCLYKDTKTPKNSIPFKDRVDCAVKIGFVE